MYAGQDNEKHTPGPWTAPDLHFSERFEGITGLSYFACDVLNPTPEEKANIALIAAAPELLSVLKRLVFATQEYLPAYFDTNTIAWRAHQNAVEIIAKAEDRAVEEAVNTFNN
jgi:hypothetical protein